MARPTLERHMGVKNIKASIDKRTASCSIVNAIKNKHSKALIKVNKNRKHNGNIFKNRCNRIKKLAL